MNKFGNKQHQQPQLREIVRARVKEEGCKPEKKREREREREQEDGTHNSARNILTAARVPAFSNS